MLNVGLTGGLATGKSTVGRLLAGLGCYLIQMDQLGHQVMEPGGEAYTSVVEHFGPEVLNPDSSVNRRKLGAVVFTNPTQLARLNSLIHPPVRTRAKTLADVFFAREPDGIAIVEAAILVETGSHRDYDRLIVVACRPEQQMERAIRRDNLSRDEVQKRLDSQMPICEKVKYADYVVDTSGSAEDTAKQVQVMYAELATQANRNWQRAQAIRRKETQS